MRKNSNSKIRRYGRQAMETNGAILSNGKQKRLFLSLDVKSKQRYKVKIDKIQRYDPYQMKKEELSGVINKFPPVQ